MLRGLLNLLGMNSSEKSSDATPLSEQENTTQFETAAIETDDYIQARQQTRQPH